MKRQYDKPFFIITLSLVLFGVFTLASASLGLITSTDPGLYHNVSRQIILGLGIGGMLFLIALRIPYTFWHAVSLPVFLLSVGLMLLVYEPHIGFSYGGANRWLHFGYFFFQPAEFLKFGFLIYLASWIAARKDDMASFKFGLAPFLLIMGFVGSLLILQPDIGTLGVITITAGTLFYIGGGRLSQIGLMLILGILLLSVLVAIEPYRLSRIIVFVNPEYDLQGAGYQLHQSLIAIGSGGIFGKGFGMSRQKFDYLPEVTSDSIFAVIAEEFGFIGVLFLLSLFLLFLWRGLFIAKNVPNIFGRLLGSGIVILILVQVFINIGAFIGLLPLTGLPLVFISQGGSSLALSLFQVGVVLNISKYRFY